MTGQPTLDEILDAVANLALAAFHRDDNGEAFGLMDDPATVKRVDVTEDGTYRLLVDGRCLWAGPAEAVNAAVRILRGKRDRLN